MLDISSIYFGGLGDFTLNNVIYKIDEIYSLFIFEKAAKIKCKIYISTIN